MQGLTGSVNAVANIAGLIAGGLVYDEIGAQVFLLSAVGGGHPRATDYLTNSFLSQATSAGSRSAFLSNIGRPCSVPS